MTVVVVQSRLSSERLPQKSLLDLQGKPLLSWVLNVARKVKADKYVLATDEESYETYLPFASEYGFDCFSGPKDDVLKRFCMVIEKTNADTIIRITGDNPFLFYESIQSLEKEYISLNCDYFAWLGLPHGSGAEIFSASKLLQAEKNTNDPYDREHVGPALYRYPQEYKIVTKKAPNEWFAPEFRTTVDTSADYEYAKQLANYMYLERKKNLNRITNIDEAFSAAEILSCQTIKRPILCVPCVQQGRGTGHLRRCIQLVIECNADIYLPDSFFEDSRSVLVSEIPQKNIRRDLPAANEYSLIVADMFFLSAQFAEKLRACAPLVALDEGSPYSNMCDFLLDIIPSCEYNREPNIRLPALLNLPKNRRDIQQKDLRNNISTVLITIGGEDPAGLTKICEQAFSTLNVHVTSVSPLSPISNLKEELYKYDLVVTHYGLTAFEAYAAGCGVLLVATSKLHKRLSKYAGFTVLPPSKINTKTIRNVVKNTEFLYPNSYILSQCLNDKIGFIDYMQHLQQSTRIDCPICGRLENRKTTDKIVFRTETATYRTCQNCGIIYLSFSVAEKKDYSESYFFEEYQNQYGKTYLEDFESIKNQGKRRVATLNRLISKSGKEKRTVLDIGCAYGPFLSAVMDNGWTAFGTDISESAIDYVTKTLQINAVCGAFPYFDIEKSFNVNQFDVVTLWFVIEHFNSLADIISAISSIVKKGGYFAFSTPSASGISARFSKKSFFRQSPSDHFTIWKPSQVEKILKPHGFCVTKVVSTGVYPERIPLLKNINKEGMLYFALKKIGTAFLLGDTFEVYCKKISK